MKLGLPLGRYCLRFLPTTEPVPVSKLVFLRKLCVGRDGLSAPYARLRRSGRELRHPALREALAGDEMGTWSMSPRTLDFLELEIRKYRPRVILEFGSGLSTVCLAQFMSDIHGREERVYVCSIEQDMSMVSITLRRLAVLNLARRVEILHAPLARQVIGGRETTCYRLSMDGLSTVRSLRPDFVVIDGPAGEIGARVGTLPLVHEAIQPGARFYLDDALRDGELDVARSWARLPYLWIGGVILTEKGLLVGHVAERRVSASGVAAGMGLDTRA